MSDYNYKGVVPKSQPNLTIDEMKALGEYELINAIHKIFTESSMSDLEKIFEVLHTDLKQFEDPNMIFKSTPKERIKIRYMLENMSVIQASILKNTLDMFFETKNNHIVQKTHLEYLGIYTNTQNITNGDNGDNDDNDDSKTLKIELPNEILNLLKE